MCKQTDNDQPSTEAAPKRPRRKYKSKKLGAAGLSARMIKKGAIRVTWEELFGRH